MERDQETQANEAETNEAFAAEDENYGGPGRGGGWGGGRGGGWGGGRGGRGGGWGGGRGGRGW